MTIELGVEMLANLNVEPSHRARGLLQQRSVACALMWTHRQARQARQARQGRSLQRIWFNRAFAQIVLIHRITVIIEIIGVVCYPKGRGYVGVFHYIAILLTSIFLLM